MKKLIITIPLFLTLAGCSSNAYNVESIIQNDDPTYMNVDKIVEDSYIFIKKGELYVLSDDEGLNKQDLMTVEDKNKVFISSVSSKDEKAQIFIGINDGLTKATVDTSSGKKNFTISVK